MMKTTINIASVALFVLGILSMSLAVFLDTRGDGWFSFFLSCPFWSATIILFLLGLRLYRAAFFGFVGAAVVGGFAFIAGFLGPIIFSPQANQGPLLGIFFTGPLGSLVGVALGLLTSIVMNKFRPPRDAPRQ